MKKRQPLLCDHALQLTDCLVDKNFLESTKQNIREAKRFVLDEQAAIYVAEMVRDLPRIIADAQDFAIPPFQKTWIEFPMLKYWETINQQPPEPDADSVLGFLVIGNIVRLVVGDAANNCMLMPYEYYLWHPLDLDDELRLVQEWQTSRLALDYVFWGSSVARLQDDHDAESLRMLRANHRLLIPKVKVAPDIVFNDVVMRSAGDLRNIIALLLFLNRTQDLQVTHEVPHQQTMLGRKQAVLLKHSVITLKLDPGPRLQTLVAGQSMWRRLHDVRGHFCHNRKARESQCLHETWDEYEPLHWRCARCQGLRWWRKEHKRGHEEKGLVTSEYRVVA